MIKAGTEKMRRSNERWNLISEGQPANIVCSLTIGIGDFAMPALAKSSMDVNTF